MVLIIHQGFLPSAELQHEIDQWGSDATVGTARLGPGATYEEPHPSLVITNDGAVAAFWEEQEVDVDYRGDGDVEPEPAEEEPVPEADLDVEQTTAVDEVAGEYRISDRGGGWKNVVGPDGEVQNESALREDDAIALRDELNA